MRSFADVFAKWDTIAAFGADIGVSSMHARAMKRRGSIPPEYWPATIAAAKKRGFSDVKLNALVELRASRRQSADGVAA